MVKPGQKMLPAAQSVKKERNAKEQLMMLYLCFSSNFCASLILSLCLFAPDLHPSSSVKLKDIFYLFIE